MSTFVFILQQLPIATPTGGVLPLATVAAVDSRRGIQRINHRNALKAVNVYANIDTKLADMGAIIRRA